MSVNHERKKERKKERGICTLITKERKKERCICKLLLKERKKETTGNEIKRINTWAVYLAKFSVDHLLRTVIPFGNNLKKIRL